MKALFFNSHGGTEKLQFGNVQKPELTPGFARIQVRAAALNHLDLWVLNGLPGLKLPLPHIGGSDISGTIEECPNKNFSPGTRVIVCPGYTESQDEWTRKDEDSVSHSYRIIGEHCWGGFAEYVDVPEACLVKLPDNIDFSQAAAPLLVGLTAWRMLVRRAELKSHETILIVGAGGGVNSFSISLSKHLGAKVIVTTRTADKKAKALALGADHVIDTSKNTSQHSEWSKEVRSLTNNRGADVVIDNVGTATLAESLKAVSRGGRIVSVGNTSGVDVTFNYRLLFGKQVSLLGSTMGSFADFRAMLDVVWAGKVKVDIDSQFPLAEGRKAYEKLQAGTQFGKIILTPE